MPPRSVRQRPLRLRLPAFAGRRRRALSGYAAAAFLVLLVAAALRFHGLSDTSLGRDEAVDALQAQGAFEEIVRKTWRGTSPILYPVALWLVQKIEISSFSVRLLPAVASVFTVFALLFSLPRVGVPRPAALFAGTTAALSCGAIFEAHGVRVYSLDALVAALLIVGLLRYTRQGARTQLGLCLFLGPLVAYGLVLFGAAVLATALLSGAWTDFREARARGRRIRWRAPARLLAPTLWFASGCAVSWFTTARQQVARLSASPEGFARPYLRGLYYDGDLTDIDSAIAFAATRTWALLTDLLAPPLVLASLLSGAVLLVVRLGRRPRPRSPTGWESGGTNPYRVVGLLFAVSLAVAAAAATAGIFPLGASRHGTYLGPVVFTAAGAVLSAALAAPSAVLRRWPTSAALGAGFCGIAWVGAAEVGRRTAFAGTGTGEEVVKWLEEAPPEDLVWVSGRVRRIVEWYAEENPEHWVWREAECHLDLSCTTDLVQTARARPDPPERIWIPAERRASPWLTESLRRWDEDLAVEALVASDGVAYRQYGGDIRLYRIDDARPLLRERAGSSDFDQRIPDWGDTPPGTPTIRSFFEVWSREDALLYHREPCSPADAQARFFLSVEASPPDEPGAAAQPRPVNLDFDFAEYGIVEDGRCLAVRPLRTEGVTAFETGQWGGATPWRARGLLDRSRHEAALRSLARGERREPDVRGDFDLWFEDSEALFHRARCSASDVEARFFFHFYPDERTALPTERREHGFLNLDFDFADFGFRVDGRCLAVVPLPESGGGRVRAGQFLPGGERLWSAEANLPPSR